MNFFTNKHVVVAMIVAPILAIITYYLVDLAVKEEPQAAVSGASYPLLAQSNCRYTSGACDLVNASFRSTLKVEGSADQSVLNMQSSHAVQEVKIGFNRIADEDVGDLVKPVAMKRLGDDGKSWSIEMPMTADKDTKLMIVLSADGAQYYADTTMEFSEYKTSFNKNFRKDQ